MHKRKLMVFAGLAGTPLAQAICDCLKIKLGQAAVGRYNDGEVKVMLTEDVRGADVFIINPTNPPAENLIDTILLADAGEGSSAGRITLVIPYLGYNRQDRKGKPRVAVSAHAIIGMLARSGCDRVLLLDVHSESTIGTFRQHHIITDHLYASIVSMDHLKSTLGANSVVATPDAGGVGRARAYAQRLGLPVVICIKERKEPGVVSDDGISVIGDVAGKNVVFIDDIIDTAGTLAACAKAVCVKGARNVRAFATHGLFSADALRVLDDSPIEEVIVTDSIPHPPGKLNAGRVKITVLSIAPLLAGAIKKINGEESLGPLIL